MEHFTLKEISIVGFAVAMFIILSCFIDEMFASFGNFFVCSSSIALFAIACSMLYDERADDTSNNNNNNHHE